MNKQRLILASDHAGFKLKEVIKLFLQGIGYEVQDVGAFEYKEDDDYPKYMTKAAMEVSKDLTGEKKAILFGGSGQGEAIVANRFPGVRAIVWYGGGFTSDTDIIKLSREHNDANVLSIGAHFVSEEEVKGAVVNWLETPFSNDERHIRRIKEIDSIE